MLVSNGVLLRVERRPDDQLDDLGGELLIHRCTESAETKGRNERDSSRSGGFVIATARTAQIPSQLYPLQSATLRTSLTPGTDEFGLKQQTISHNTERDSPNA